MLGRIAARLIPRARRFGWARYLFSIYERDAESILATAERNQFSLIRAYALMIFPHAAYSIAETKLSLHLLKAAEIVIRRITPRRLVARDFIFILLRDSVSVGHEISAVRWTVAF